MSDIFTTDLDDDGILTATWDMADRSMNVITFAVMDALDALIDEAVANERVKGVVLASGKPTFTGGADLTMLAGLFEGYEAKLAEDEGTAKEHLLKESRRLSQIYRRLETCGKPFVAAINGTCLGGGTELALACHGRVIADDDGIKFGLPEVKVGLFPGAGGTQRVMRMTDAQAGLTMLLKGQELRPKTALGMGLVDQVVPKRKLISAAKKIIADGLKAVKPWDEKGFKLHPVQRIYTPAGMQFWPAANGIYRKETQDNYPGARHLMQAVFEGLSLPMDLALRVESRHFAHVLQTPECRAMIRSLFVSMQALGKGARRPSDVKPSRLKKIGIIGAGFMGAGIASVTAKAGLDVVLMDRDDDAANAGKTKVEENLKKLIQRGRMKPEAAEALLARITPSADYAALTGADLVIEAVFENRDVKAAVMEGIKPHVKPSTIIASNTSTLPITSLAKNAPKPSNFIGIHFFSPVEKMMLVEVIVGKRTNDKALAVALDFIKAIKKTPIVVNDARGFYVNRCVLTYMLEAHLMVAEGVPPAMVENLAKQAGMPVGPLALNDEVGLDLGYSIMQATKADLGEKAVDPTQEALMKALVVDHGRHGRKNGKGFYDYEGRTKRLWPGLADVVEPQPAETFSKDELIERLLVTQALEAARCMEAGVVTDPREADVGSILGYGFAPFSGGTLSYIDTMGADAFLKTARRLQRKHGKRFKPPKLLVEIAANGETFYGRFGGEAESRPDKAAA